MLGALQTYFGAVPWAVPFMGLAAVGLVLSARPITARTGLPAWLVVTFGMSIACFVGVTATPGSSGLVENTARQAVWSFHVPSLQELAQVHDPWALSEPALNAWLAVPLGFMAAVAACVARSAWPVVIAGMVPVAAEGVQWTFPSFGRTAFFFGDVVANWSGLLIGGAVGLAGTTACVLIQRGSSKPK